MPKKPAGSHTATDIEPYFLDALRDGAAHRIREVYASVERAGVLSSEDYCRIPMSAGYKRLADLGIDVKQQGASTQALDALVAIHELPSELHYRNRIRHARRTLLRKEHIISPGTDLVQITPAGQQRLAALFKDNAAFSTEDYSRIRYLGPTEGNMREDDGPTTALQAVRARRGQTKFRNLLRSRYGDRCVMCGESLLDVLEAAHIQAVADGGPHAADNGLLLRADIHTLFDLDLIGIHPADLSLHLHDSLQGTGYAALLTGRRLQVENELGPNRDRLGHRWSRFLRRKHSDKEAE